MDIIVDPTTQKFTKLKSKNFIKVGDDKQICEDNQMSLYEGRLHIIKLFWK